MVSQFIHYIVCSALFIGIIYFPHSIGDKKKHFAVKSLFRMNLIFRNIIKTTMLLNLIYFSSAHFRSIHATSYQYLLLPGKC